MILTRQKSWSSAFQLCFSSSLGSVAGQKRKYSFSTAELGCLVFFFFNELLALFLFPPLWQRTVCLSTPAKAAEKMLLPMADAKRTTNLQLSRLAAVGVSRLPSTIPSYHTPRSFLSSSPPCVVLRPVALCKQDVGAVLKRIPVPYTSVLTSGCCVHPACNICFR